MSEQEDKMTVEQLEEYGDFEKGLDHVRLAEATKDVPVNIYSKNILKLYGICFVMFLLSTMHGYDGSLMGSMLVMQTFLQEFGAHDVGVKSALITAMYQIGGVCSLPFIGPLCDSLGRRYTIVVSDILIITGTILEGTSATNANLHQYMAGRFFLGFGVNIAASAGPQYVVEIAHPKFRGRLTGMFNTFYYTGAILASGVVRGSVVYTTNKSWLLPTWIQLVFPSIVAVSCLFFPETPRWLYAHGKKERAVKVLTKYHGDGDESSPFVVMQLLEIEESIDLNGSDKRWWDYRSLIRNRGSIHRVLAGSIFLMFTQWCQGGVGYFIASFYSYSGITNEVTVLDLNLVATVIGLPIALAGSAVCDLFKRRTMMITGFMILTFGWIGMIVGIAVYQNHGLIGGARASIFFYWFMHAIFSFFFTPLQALYPVEVLSYEQRAKGTSFEQFAGNAASLVNQFGTPVGLANIGYKFYSVWCIMSALGCVVTYFGFPECRGFSLEEIDRIFQSKNPVKASLNIRN